MISFIESENVINLCCFFVHHRIVSGFDHFRYFGSLLVTESKRRISPLPVAKPNFILFTYLVRKQSGSNSCQEEVKDYKYCKNMLYTNFRLTYALVAS